MKITRPRRRQHGLRVRQAIHPRRPRGPRDRARRRQGAATSPPPIPGASAVAPPTRRRRAPTRSSSPPAYDDAVPRCSRLGNLAGKVVDRHHQPADRRLHGPDHRPRHLRRRGDRQGGPGAEVVKAFNTVFAQVLAEGADFGDGRGRPRSTPATASAPSRPRSTLAESIGFKTVDAGGAEERALPRAAGRTEHLLRLRRRPRHRHRTDLDPQGLNPSNPPIPQYWRLR